MKAWEMINALKGTDANRDEIRDWALMNKIIPCDFKYELELEEGQEYPKVLKDLSDASDCAGITCNQCLEKFLDSEVEDF